MYLQTMVDVQPTITPQAIIANTLLQMSSDELEQAINEALNENPALDMPAPALCPRCNGPLVNSSCPFCRGQSSQASIREDDEGWWTEDSRWPNRNTSFDEDEDFDPMTILAAEQSLSEYLRVQVAMLIEDDTEEEIAGFIIDSLDERGFLPLPIEEVAANCFCEPEEAERVLRKLQGLDPSGIAARSLQECLLLQLAQLQEAGEVVGTSIRIVRDHWDALAKLSLDTIARQLRVGEEQVSQAVDFIGRNLNPFPANIDWRGPGPRRQSGAIHPDIIVRRKREPDDGYEIEIPESRKYRLRVNGLYHQMVRDIRSGRCDASYGDKEHLREHLAQARLFINCVRQRWQTLERIALLLVDVQRGFLESGYRHLKPLTRSLLADIVGVHESTVGRAVAGKSLMLPNNRIVPLSDFFDGSLAVKCIIEEIVLQEGAPLSDQRIAELLQERGYDIARRTVAKYRDAVGIPPARVRGALKNRGWKPLWVPPEHAQAF
ncbi:MAG: RNA polymerase factor sigma-54 [Anaerolineae bacterium]